jgi:outer membrane protein assembly factor BamE (lipoprotein component of BamABCDE complex)
MLIDLGAQGCNGKAVSTPNLPETPMPSSIALNKSRGLMAIALSAGLLLSSGCTQLKAHQGYVGDAKLLQSVQAGVDNKDSVTASLGRPTFIGQFDTNDWYYFARDTKQLAFAKPKASNQFVLHIRFDGAGNVASVKQSAMENIARISPEGDKTPTLGREKSFFEELFGNIGSVGAGGGAGSQGGGGN